MGKNFGTILIPEGLPLSLNQFGALIKEFNTIFKGVLQDSEDELKLKKNFSDVIIIN